MVSRFQFLLVSIVLTVVASSDCQDWACHAQSEDEGNLLLHASASRHPMMASALASKKQKPSEQGRSDSKMQEKEKTQEKQPRKMQQMQEKDKEVEAESKSQQSHALQTREVTVASTSDQSKWGNGCPFGFVMNGVRALVQLGVNTMADGDFLTKIDLRPKNVKDHHIKLTEECGGKITTNLESAHLSDIVTPTLDTFDCLEAACEAWSLIICTKYRMRLRIGTSVPYGEFTGQGHGVVTSEPLSNTSNCPGTVANMSGNVTFRLESPKVVSVVDLVVNIFAGLTPQAESAMLLDSEITYSSASFKTNMTFSGYTRNTDFATKLLDKFKGKDLMKIKI
eukprot:TRINITY_DN23297_c0_g1_i1.p1 TRINITY_DN23297_c0_g1~~TRINITY_DN23297_c0_g1_i1.p1  ORF type:complete len:338 (+),score=55.58 TRINITY_DN23297_c0_g1_i1:99-1112(+)